MTKIVHIADIHWRGMQRHDEYTQVFTEFFKKMEDIRPDYIVVAGDIVHSKTQGISPELVDRLRWWFKGLAKWKTIVTLGNHDGLIYNKSRMDAISPIIAALDDQNIFFLKDSGNYKIGNINFCNFSCFDEEGWSKCAPNDDLINIALYHGAVGGSILDTGMPIDGEVSVEMFKKYDYSLLGDIHKRQFLDKERRIAYPGSTIQQNYGEDLEKGFLVWQIQDKNNHTVKFHQLKNVKPFITIEWDSDVTSTVQKIQQIERGARVRVLNNSSVNINETKQLNGELKEKFGASEVIWKFNGPTESVDMKAGEMIILKDNLRDPATIRNLFKDYAKNKNLSDGDIQKIDSIVAKLIDSLPNDERLTNVKWTIKSLNWDNTYGYGQGNSIDFESMEGITGIFGKNAQGKSSIPGTIMYALFNSTDRGPIKNLHVINTRKDYCLASVILHAADSDYKVERQSVKHQSKAGVQSAVTNLNVFKLDSHGNHLEDITGEQRKESEKVLRSLIGTSEDFLLTSFAAQGEMNAFLKERATARKNILSKFLNLHIFESLQSLAKERSSAIKSDLGKKSPGRDINVVISEKKNELLILNNNIIEIDKRREEFDKSRLKLQSLLEKKSINSSYKIEDVSLNENKIKSLTNKINESQRDLEKYENEKLELETKIEKLENIMSSFDVASIKNEISQSEALKSKIDDLQSKVRIELDSINKLEKSIQNLKDVPCGDKFPTCKYIKDSHHDRSVYPDKKKFFDEISTSLNELKSNFDSSKLVSNKQTYEKITTLQSKLPIMKSSLSVAESKISSLKILIQSQKEEKVRTENLLIEIKASVQENDLENIASMKSQISSYEQKISSLDKESRAGHQKIGAISNEIENLETQAVRIKELQVEWKLYELILAATGKDGIPLQIIASQLPRLNSEISKILMGVSNFSVEIVANEDDGDLDIFIDYGNAKCPIEMASGMEKMMSSLAIRAALIEISAIHKSDLFIIDEGFGALDDTNIEACARLLTSLKRNFRNMLIISHVDSIKDIVDNVIEISNNGVDANVRY